MDMVRLGRTDLRASVAGLGCGGHSRLGMARGENEAHASRIVKHALALGINFIDTARGYGTEAAVGKAISGKRDQVILSTKASLRRRGVARVPPGTVSARDLVDSLEKSLAAMATDYVDVFHIHGLHVDQYDYAMKEILPAMKEQQRLGKIRFLGVTETFGRDSSHEMFKTALPDDPFDVVMVGFNLLNPSARTSVFPLTLEKDVGTLIMYAVRRALSNPQSLQDALEKIIAAGQIGGGRLHGKNPLGFVSEHPEISSIVQAAYRFCRHEPGADVILTGTGSTEHLEENVASILAPPLPEDVMNELTALFGEVDCVSGN